LVNSKILQTLGVNGEESRSDEIRLFLLFTSDTLIIRKIQPPQIFIIFENFFLHSSIYFLELAQSSWRNVFAK